MEGHLRIYGFWRGKFIVLTFAFLCFSLCSVCTLSLCLCLLYPRVSVLCTLMSPNHVHPQNPLCYPMLVMQVAVLLILKPMPKFCKDVCLPIVLGLISKLKNRSEIIQSNFFSTKPTFRESTDLYCLQLLRRYGGLE